MLSSESNKLVVYHARCCDGQGAAAAFYSKYSRAQFFPGHYAQPLPDFTGRDVYFLDFSVTRQVMEEILKVANSVTIIDHHKSAIEELSDLEYPKFTKFFDVNHSGAVLTWKWCYPTAQIPPVLSFIEDRDLQRYKLTGTREINAYLYSLEFDILEWATEFLNDSVFNYRFGQILFGGQALLKQEIVRKEALLRNARLIRIGGLKTAAVNCNDFMASDVGQELAKGRFFAATYYDTAECRVFSLYSSAESTADVSAIAKTYGGGGNVYAAGFRVDFATAAKMEL